LVEKNLSKNKVDEPEISDESIEIIEETFSETSFMEN
jgi:hypothetical protein